ncbi:MAG: hypothetical protein AAF721_41695 [Myxococcota bacterium]
MRRTMKSDRGGGWLRAAGLGAVLALGCSAGEPGEGLTSLSLPGAGDPSAGDSGDDSGTTEAGSDDARGSGDSGGAGPDAGASTSGAETAGDDGGGTTGGGRSTFNPLDEDGGDADGGEQPDTGMWSSCDGGGSCGGGLTCLGTDDMTMGVCTTTCAPAGNPAGCGGTPGGTATPSCLAVGGQSICALSCADDESCPGGMTCVPETDDAGAIAICL